MTFQSKWRTWPPSLVGGGIAVLAFWWASGLFLPLPLLLVMIGAFFIVGRQGFAAAAGGAGRAPRGR
ncbi:MAG: hypothetical protein V4510_09035 [bacterium]